MMKAITSAKMPIASVTAKPRNSIPRSPVVAEENAEASAGADQAGHGKASADKLGRVNGRFHVEKVPC